MNQIPTLYTDYKECMSDLDKFGKIVSTPRMSADECLNAFFEEFERIKPLPTLEYKRYEISRSVSSEYNITYNNELELQDNEVLIDLKAAYVEEYMRFEEVVKTTPAMVEEFMYEMGTTDDMRQELISKYDISTGEVLEEGVAEEEDVNTLSTATDVDMSSEYISPEDDVLEEQEQSEGDNEDMADDNIEDDYFEDEESYFSDGDSAVEDDEDVEDDYFSNDESEETGAEDLAEEDYFSEDEEDYSESDDIDEELNESDSSGDDYFDDDGDDYFNDDEDGYFDEEDGEAVADDVASGDDSYFDEDEDDYFNEENEEDVVEEEVTEDLSSDDESDYFDEDGYFDEESDGVADEDSSDDYFTGDDEDNSEEELSDDGYFDDDAEDTYFDNEESNDIENSGTEDDYFADNIADEADTNGVAEPFTVDDDVGDEIDFIQPGEIIPAAEEVYNPPQPQPPPVVPPQESTGRGSEPTDLRQFLRKHPRCEYDFALKYFTKKQINDAIKMGKIVKKGNILKI